MDQKTIKLSELKKIIIKNGEVLAIRSKKDKLKEMSEIGEWLGNQLKCPVVIVDNFDSLRVISNKK